MEVLIWVSGAILGTSWWRCWTPVAYRLEAEIHSGILYKREYASNWIASESESMPGGCIIISMGCSQTWTDLERRRMRLIRYSLASVGLISTKILSGSRCRWSIIVLSFSMGWSGTSRRWTAFFEAFDGLWCLCVVAKLSHRLENQ